MKRAAAIALLVLAPAVQAQNKPVAVTHYLPPDTFPARQQMFHEGWFGSHFVLMSEPVLWGRAAIAGYRFRFRMLVLPSFYRPYVIGVDQRADGRIEWRYIRISGQGGYRDGGVEFRRSERLAPDRLARLKTALAAARFKDRLVDKREEREFASDPPRRPIPVMDGTQLVFEMLDRRGHHLVMRHDSELDTQMRAIAAAALAAAEIVPNPVQGDPEP